VGSGVTGKIEHTSTPQLNSPCLRLLPTTMRKRFGSSQSRKNTEREYRLRITYATRGKRPLKEAGTQCALDKSEDWKLSLPEQILKPTEERYADAAISDPNLFDAIEVHRINEFSDSDGRDYAESDCQGIPPSSFGVLTQIPRRTGPHSFQFCRFVGQGWLRFGDNWKHQKTRHN